MSFTVVTYNILANTYIRPAWYPYTPPEMLVAAQRGPAHVRHILGLAADVLCRQEVEDDMFAALEAGLRPGGYTGHLSKKAAGKPDGCALFFRTGVFAALDIIPGADAQPLKPMLHGRGNIAHDIPILGHRAKETAHRVPLFSECV